MGRHTVPIRVFEFSLLVLMALALASASAAQAARPALSFLTQTASGPHFVVHFTSSGGSAGDRITPATAEGLVSYAESGYAWEVTSQGYPAPLSDGIEGGDSRTDIYVFNVPIGPAAGRDSEITAQTSGFILITPSTATSVYPVSHELFHVIQFAILSHSGFFSEGSAEWAGQAVVAANGGAPPPNWFPYPEVSLDCISPTCGGNGGYQGSIFWEYLGERFGTGIVHEAFDRDAALTAAAVPPPNELRALGEALAAHGSSVADAFEGYAVAAMAGQITRPGVLPHLPAADHAVLADMSINYPPDTVSVDHLAMKQVTFLGGEPESSAPCKPATLRLTVDLPPGVPTRPVFVTYPADGLPPATAVYPLTIAGTTAGAEVPWPLCAATIGALALPNASTGADAQPFTVHATVVSPPRPKRPRLSGKTTQDIDKLAIRVRTSEAASVLARASVQVAGHRLAIKSKPARGKTRAGRALILHLRFAPSKLKAIKASLLSSRRLTAKIRVTASTAAGTSATATKRVKLKP